MAVDDSVGDTPPDDPVQHPEGPTPGRPPGPGDDEVEPGWPWSFLLLVAAGALYLIFRFVELGIELFN